MKISICGKGGCGKSTITTLLAESLVKKGREVLIIDSDESNYGLHRHLGMENPKDFTGYFGGKDSVLSDLMLSNFSHRFFNESWKIEDIPEGYYTERGGIKLMVSGKIHQANEGCACAMNTVMKQFVMNLKLDSNQVAIMDMEAGIEHFGRGLDDGADMILMVCDPSYESLKLAKKIEELAESIDKPVFFLLNKIQKDNREIVYEAIEKKERIALELPLLNELTQASLKGERLEEIPDSLEVFTEKLVRE